MQHEDFDRFDALVQGVADCYGQTLTAPGIVMRFKLLERFCYNDVEKAALAVISARKYTSMPTPADFLEHLSGGSVEDRAEVEAGKVLAAIAKYGGYASVVFDDPVTQAVIVQAYGGWVKLCADCGVEESEKWFRKDFARIWGAYKRQGVQLHGHLPGRFEISNHSNGRLGAIPGPQCIGDQDKARAVLEAGQPGLLAASMSVPLACGAFSEQMSKPALLKGKLGMNMAEDGLKTNEHGEQMLRQTGKELRGA